MSSIYASLVRGSDYREFEVKLSIGGRQYILKCDGSNVSVIGSNGEMLGSVFLSKFIKSRSILDNDEVDGIIMSMFDNSKDCKEFALNLKKYFNCNIMPS